MEGLVSSVYDEIVKNCVHDLCDYHSCDEQTRSTWKMLDEERE